MPDSEAVGAMTPLREFFLLSSVITCFVDLLEGAGVATGTGGAAAAAACAGAFGTATVFATAGGIVGAACFTFEEAAAGAGADFGLLGATAGLLVFVGFDAAFAAGLGAVFTAGFAAGFATDFAAGFAAFAAGFVVFFAGAAAFAGTFFEGALDVFFTALALAVPLPLATTFFAVLRVLFAISVHRCG
jgi:hypothetical protein